MKLGSNTVLSCNHTEETIFMHKFKANLRFLGILFVRILAGVVVGHLWVVVVAINFHLIAENVVSQHVEIGPHRGLYDYFDRITYFLLKSLIRGI